MMENYCYTNEELKIVKKVESMDMTSWNWWGNFSSQIFWCIIIGIVLIFINGGYIGQIILVIYCVYGLHRESEIDYYYNIICKRNKK